MQGALAYCLPAAAAACTARSRAGRAAGPARATSSLGRSKPFQSGSRAQRRGKLVVVAAVKVAKGKEVLCNKTLRCKEGQAEAVLALCQDLVAWSREVARDKSRGIKAFDVVQDAYDNNMIYLYEIYYHSSLLSQHNTSERFTAFMEEVQGFLEEPIGMIMYDFRNGEIGAPCMEGGPKGEGGLDDATGASKMSGGAGFKQTSASLDLTQVVEEEGEEAKGLWGMKLMPWATKK